MSEEKHDQRTFPITDAVTAPFWQAVGERRLLAPRSPETGEIHWPPRALPPPGENDFGWEELNGQGTVYTFSVVYRSSYPKPATPYVLAVVQLKEGLHITTNIVGVDPEKVYIGMPVKVTFEALNDSLCLPVFVPDLP